MQYTKPMVDLVYEIRRRVDSEMKPGVKMANPELLKELAEYHHHCKDTITKALIKELLFMAGPTWATLLHPNSDEHKETNIPRQVVKVYRGQTILEDAAQENTVVRAELLAPASPLVDKPVRMYRGHPVL